MRLLFVHNNFGDFGGAESYVQQAAKGLRELGHRAALCYARKTGRNEADWDSAFSECFGLEANSSAARVDAVIEDFQPDLLFIHNWAALDSLERFLRSGVPAARMVHDHSMYCLRSYKYNWFTRRICTRPASGHCVFPCLAPLQRKAGPGVRVQWASYSQKIREIRLHRECAALLVYSRYQQQELERNGFDPEKILICPLLRPGNGEEPASNCSEENLVLFAGQVIRGKGVDALLRALAKVRAPFHCVILGDGNHRGYCQRLCVKLGLGERVTFQGYVPPAEMRQFYLRASLFAMSSLWPEPFGMAGPEAMRYGLPVVAFDAGAISEWLRHEENGLLVPWNDTELYAQAITRLLSDKSLARRLGARARDFVARFDAPTQLRVLEGVLAGLCGGAGHEPSRTGAAHSEKALCL